MMYDPMQGDWIDLTNRRTIMKPQPTTSTTEPATPLTWDAFVEKAVAEGWCLHECETFIDRDLPTGEITICVDHTWEITRNESILFPCDSYELALAAANAVAKAVGGWRS